jgi:hypothetical protein
MIPLFKNFFRSLFYDEKAAAIWVRSVLLWLGTMLGSILAYPFEEVQTWNLQEWGYRVIAAGVIGFAGLIRVGQQNLTPAEMAEQLDSYRKEQALKANGSPTP